MTGASGYLGRKLVQRFVQQGYELTLLVRKQLNVASAQVSELVIPPSGLVDKNVVGAHDAVVHCATNYGRNGASLADISWVNYEWPAQLASSLAESGVFLHIDTALPDGVSPYATEKGRLRRFLLEQQGSRSCNVRLEHFYGAGDGHFLSAVLTAFFSKQPILPLTAGTQRRDFIWVDDAVDGIVVVLEHLFRRAVPAEVGLGTGSARSIREVVEELSALCGPHETELRFGAVAMREGEPLESKADLRALQQIGWTPSTPWEAGIRRFVDDSRVLWAQRATLRWLDELQF